MQVVFAPDRTAIAGAMPSFWTAKDFCYRLEILVLEGRQTKILPRGPHGEQILLIRLAAQ